MPSKLHNLNLYFISVGLLVGVSYGNFDNIIKRQKNSFPSV